MHLKIIKSSALYGINISGNPSFSWIDWWNGKFQKDKENYINDNIGFRSDYVRLNNQISFSLFQHLNYGGTFLGKNNYLFFDDYINEFTGADFSGDTFSLARIKRLKKLQDTLENLGKTLLFVFAPNKAEICSEFLPSKYKFEENRKTNHEVFKQQCEKEGVKYIDFNGWYLTLKKTSQYPLFTPTGTHWSLYGAMFAVDSIIKYIEKQRNISMPHPSWQVVERTKKPRKTDNDIEALLNLIFPIYNGYYYYPVYEYKIEPNQTKPRTIYVGDSYNFTLLFDGILNANTDGQYWGYFKDVFLNPDNVYCKIEGYNWMMELNKADCIVILYTSSRLTHMGNNFIDSAYAKFYP